MQIEIAGWRFRISAIPALAMLLLFPLLLALGFWQLGRAQAKAELLALRAQQSDHDIQDVAQMGEFRDEDRYRAVEGYGRYVADRQVLVDNRTHVGRAGYHVLTPLRLDSGVAVLVNRGWVEIGTSRERLPPIPAPQGDVVVRGILDRAPRPGLRLGDGVVARAGWPMVVLEVDFQSLSDALGLQLLPVLVLLGPKEPDGFVREWEPDPDFGPDRHVGYAVQWFSLAAALLVIFVVVNLRRVQDGSD